MRIWTTATALSVLAAFPSLAGAQAPAVPALPPIVFEQLRDSQWVRLAAPGVGRRQGRLLEHNATELVLGSDQQPLRIPATEVDTLWTRGRSTVAGFIVGAVLVGALGAVAGTALGEENAGSAGNVVGGAGLGVIGGGLLGALIGTAIPRWDRRLP